MSQADLSIVYSVLVVFALMAGFWVGNIMQKEEWINKLSKGIKPEDLPSTGATTYGAEIEILLDGPRVKDISLKKGTSKKKE